MLALTALALPVGSAAATSGTVPPGISGANQYTETLPGPGGNEPTSGIGDKGKRRRWADAGEGARPRERRPAGSARTGRAGGGPVCRAERAREHRRAAARVGGTSNPSGSSGLSQVLGQLTGSSDSGGMGLLLPLLIAMTIVGAAAYGFGRRRTAHPQD